MTEEVIKKYNDVIDSYFCELNNLQMPIEVFENDYTKVDEVNNGINYKTIRRLKKSDDVVFGCECFMNDKIMELKGFLNYRNREVSYLDEVHLLPASNVIPIIITAEVRGNHLFVDSTNNFVRKTEVIPVEEDFSIKNGLNCLNNKSNRLDYTDK